MNITELSSPPGAETLNEGPSQILSVTTQVTPKSKIPIKQERISEVPSRCFSESSENSQAPGNIKTELKTSSRCPINSHGVIEMINLDLKNNKLTVLKQKCPKGAAVNSSSLLANDDEVPININALSEKTDTAEMHHARACTKVGCKNKNHMGFTNLSLSDKAACYGEVSEEQTNALLCGTDNLPFKTEIELGEIKVGGQIEPHIKSENSLKPQLSILIERLSMKNEDHQRAIGNMPKIVIKLKKFDSRIIQRVNRKGFVKLSSDLLKPLLPQRQKKVYPEGHYFARKKNVVYDKDEVDKKFFKNALRRGANIDDQGKFLRYQCPKCPYKTLSFFGLSQHHRSLHGIQISRTFTCSDCDFTTKQESALTRHQQRHKKEPDLPCPHCPYVTRFDVALRTHLRRWHLSDEESKTLRCSDCNFRSICKTSYDAHIMVHIKRGENALHQFIHNSDSSNKAAVLQCEYCRFITPHKNSLRRHMQDTHKVKTPFVKQPYQCKECGFQTKLRFSFKDHTRLHENVEDVGLLRCYNCDYKTKLRKYLVVHMRTEHARVKKQQEKVYYYCAHCEKKYPLKYSLKNHIFQQHRDSEVFMCQDCNYTTKRMAILKRHTLTRHINPKKKVYQCQRCDHVSKDKTRHLVHRRTHKCECYICGFQTLDKGTVRHHIMGHMNKIEQKSILKFYRCGNCEYESRDKHLYERHMRRWGHHPRKNKVKDHQSGKVAKKCQLDNALTLDKLQNFDQPLDTEVENPKVKETLENKPREEIVFDEI